MTTTISTRKWRALIALICVFASICVGFVAGFLVFIFGFAWFRNGLALFNQWWATRPDLRTTLAAVAVVVLGSSVFGAIGGAVFWHAFVDVARRYGLEQRSPLARPRGTWYRRVAYLLWGTFGFSCAGLLVLPSITWLLGGRDLLHAVAPSLSHPVGHSSNEPWVAVLLGVLTCVPVTLLACLEFLRRRVGVTDEEIEN